MDYSHLQNGSDVRGIAQPGPDGRPVDLTQPAVTAIAAGFAAWLAKRTGKNELRVAVGRDSRLSGPQLEAWTCAGLAQGGAAVTSFGLASTPAMFMSTVTAGWAYDGAVMITASHLPFHRNGLKFFTPAGGVEKEDIAAILALAADITPTEAPAEPERRDFMPVYAAQLAQKIRAGVQAKDHEHPLAGLHVVVDAGNGAGGFFVEGVLKPLGANTDGSRYLEPDGRFPNHIPNPENAEAMQSIQDAVLASKADLGIIFDTDVDRAGAVLADGEELNRNRLIALMSAILLRDHPGTTIVTDSVTSTGLAAFIAAHGGVHCRYKRGYRNVIGKAQALNAEGVDAQLAMETSGHGALKENYFMDDGAYLMVKLLIELGRGQDLEEMLSTLAQPAESAEVRMNLAAADRAAYGQKVLDTVRAALEKAPGCTLAPDNFEGVRFEFDKDHGDGWMLLRMSLHDPLMPLNIESNRAGGAAEIARQTLPALAGFTELDTSALAALAHKE